MSTSSTSSTPSTSSTYHYEAQHALHVFPATDTRTHVADAACWCRPTPDPEEPYMFRHRSLDQRTRYETAANAAPEHTLWG